MARVVLGVSGGIAAYKAALLLRLFTEAGHHVDVIPTEAALRFVGAPTWEALSGQPVSVDVFSDVPGVRHVSLGQQADLVVVAPATADLLARAAAGQADDLLTSTLLATRAPVLFAPAMHTEMWQHPATVANVATLRARGAHVLEPASGRLTGTDTGPGRLPEPADIQAAALDLLSGPAAPAVSEAPTDLVGVRVLISAGGTREPLDPVRYLGNRSSGKQGYALAAAAAARGAEVTLLSANSSRRAGGSLDDPPGVQVLDVGSALELREAMLRQVDDVDVVVMAAAVADFRPTSVAEHKIKKADGDDSAPTITLVRNPDILAELCEPAARAARRPQVIVGFAAETGDETTSVLEFGRAKLHRKGCDLIVVNEVGTGKVFGMDDNTVTILGSDGSQAHAGPADKITIAHAVLSAVTARRSESGPSN